mmetsp:Transcript_64386/g.178289  ORF Transcript_64386/g.178289 Transcript_64386/m.178289 type:complete len:168 (-) Transcript_64386:442-945(-)
MPVMAQAHSYPPAAQPTQQWVPGTAPDTRLIWLKKVYALGMGMRWLAIIDMFFLIANVLLYWEDGGLWLLLRCWGPLCGFFGAAPRFKKYAALFFAVSYFFQVAFLFVFLAIGYWVSLLMLILDMVLLYYTSLFTSNLFKCSPSEVEMLRNPASLVQSGTTAYFYYF